MRKDMKLDLAEKEIDTILISSSKYADNGKAKTEEEVSKYINEYKKRVGRQFIFETFLDKSANILNRFLTNRESRARRLIKSIYYKIK